MESVRYDGDAGAKVSRLYVFCRWSVQVMYSARGVVAAAVARYDEHVTWR
jgi:hypothetical protein